MTLVEWVASVWVLGTIATLVTMPAPGMRARRRGPLRFIVITVLCSVLWPLYWVWVLVDGIAVWSGED